MRPIRSPDVLSFLRYGDHRELHSFPTRRSSDLSLNRDDSPPQGLKPSLVLHDLRGAKAPLYHSAAGFRDFFRSCSAVRNLLLASLPHPLIHPIIYGLVPKLGILRLQDPMAFVREIEHLRRHAQP